MAKLVSSEVIAKRIFIIRGHKVMVDRDLAELYDVRTIALRQQIKRNSERFPKDFCFQLTEKEADELITNCDRLSLLKHSPTTILLPENWTNKIAGQTAEGSVVCLQSP